MYISYSALAQEKLYDCLVVYRAPKSFEESLLIVLCVQLYTWYADTTNFVKNIRPVYGQLLPFPSRYLVPIQLKKNAKARLTKYNVEIKDDDSGLPQNEMEEMKELRRTGWHYVSRERSRKFMTSLVIARKLTVCSRCID